MTIILRAEDAKDWMYKGEGAANLVLSYHGSSPFLVGKVLRIQKVLKGIDRSEILSRFEQQLWGHVIELVESTSKEMADRVFIMHVMSPLLDSMHVDPGIQVTMTREFVESVEKNVHSQRPGWRVDATVAGRIRDSALLLSDHSVFLSGGLKENISLAVEIKPKCGFLASSEYIAKRNAIKRHVTRFRMHQLLKFKQGEISRISDYDPLDLFSRSRDRIYRAILALFATPQNNFRIFINGSLVYGGLGGGTDIGAFQSHELGEKIENMFKANGLRIESFLELVTEVIIKSGVLNRLQAAQQLDLFDIEGAIHSYYEVISQPCVVCKNLDDEDLKNRYSFFHSLRLDETVKIVRDYLIAATAKDCSLMLSFRPSDGGGSASESDSVYVKSSNQSFDYKAYFIDLDMKPLKKMTHYYDLDQKIVNLYTENMAIEGTQCEH